VRFESLDDYASKVGEWQEVLKLKDVSLDVEVGAIGEMLAEQAGPLVVYEQMAGCDPDFRLAVNIFNTPARFAFTIGLDPGTHPVDIVRRWRDIVKRPLIDPVPAERSRLFEGKCREFTDLTAIPQPRWHENDGGRYIGTGDIVVLKDPDSDWVNLGTYRLAVVDERRATLWIDGSKHGRLLAQKYWRQGRRAPIAIVLGADPVTWFAANNSLPAGVSEYGYAGMLHGEPVGVVPSPEFGLPVPCSSELVLEGEFAAPEDGGMPEGPFGEWPGYYSHTGTAGVVHVKRVLAAERAIMHGDPNYRPLAAMRGVPTFAASLWDQLERSGVDGIAGVWGFCHTLMIVISLRQRYPGHAKQALMSAIGNRQKSAMYCYYVAVDDDVDPSNLEEVIWAMCTRVDPAQDVDIIRGMWTGGIDPRLVAREPGSGSGVMSRMTVDACRPLGSAGSFPVINKVSDEERARVMAKWGDVINSAVSQRAT
jgi:UbiD family decarboxylase